MAELEDNSQLRGSIDGIIITRNGRVAEGDAEHEELLNLVRNALDEDEASENGDRAADKKES